MKQVLFWPATNKNKYFVKVCNTWFSRLRGLYFHSRSCLCVIFPCNSIHTFFFFRKLDVAFLTKDYKVIKAIRGLKPWRICSCKDAYFIVERFSDPNSTFYRAGEILF